MKCWSFQGKHSSFGVTCTYCAQIAVFHWRRTYPDLLLCADCLEIYPEVLAEAAYRGTGPVAPGADQRELAADQLSFHVDGANPAVDGQRVDGGA